MRTLFIALCARISLAASTEHDKGYYYMDEINDAKYCEACHKAGYVLRKNNAECSSVDTELAPHQTCTVEECAQLCLAQDGCQYFIVGNGEIDGVDKTGHCFWEKTTNGCKNKDDTFNHNAYDFYALCRKSNDKTAEYQCKKEPAKLTAGQCTKRVEKNEKKDTKVEKSSGKPDEHESEYYEYYYAVPTTEKKYCFDCHAKGHVLRKEGAECSSTDVELAPHKTCTIDECAQLCLAKEGCNYFIVGTGEIDGVDKTGHCFWEKTTNGCKNKDDTFTHNAYNFYALCRTGNVKKAEYQCKGEPAKLTAGQCTKRDEDDGKAEKSSGKPDEHESEYYDYYYAVPTTDKKYCFDCRDKGYVLRKEGAECSSTDAELAPHKVCTVKECAKLCLAKEGCNYFIVGTGEIDGVDKTGHCFWEQTSNGCKDKDETYTHNAYDFYELCRKGNAKNAEYQCKEEPAKLNAGECTKRHAKGGHTENIRKENGKGEKNRKEKTNGNGKPDAHQPHDSDTLKERTPPTTSAAPKPVNGGSTLMAISGVLVGVFALAVLVIFGRRYWRSKQNDNGNTSNMGHVYGVGASEYASKKSGFQGLLHSDKFEDQSSDDSQYSSDDEDKC